MQITFRYTDQEYVQSRRINKMLGMPRWKSLAIALLCLLPSLALVTYTGSLIAIVSFILVAAVLFFLVAWTALRQPGQRDKYDHVMTFSPRSLHEKNSHSETEVSWEQFDELIEREDEFLLRRLERHVWLPKRAFTAEQIAEFRSIAANLNGELTDDDPPVPLYSRLYSKPGLGPIRFAYDQQDLVSANVDPLRIIDASTSETKQNRPASNWLVATWLAILLLVLYYAVRSPPGPGSSWGIIEFLFLAFVIVLPFALLMLASRIARRRAARKSPSPPADEQQLVVLKNGFAVGTANNVSFFDWRDVDAFYKNNSCFGFKTFNDLIQIIPMRIFADRSAADQFLKQTIGLHREFGRSFEASSPAVETGNPYQPPSG